MHLESTTKTSRSRHSRRAAKGADSRPDTRRQQGGRGVLALAGLGALALAVAAAGCASSRMTSSSASAAENPTMVHGVVPPPPSEPQTQLPAEYRSWPYQEAASTPAGVRPYKLINQLTFSAGGSALNQEAKGALIEASRQLKLNPRWQALLVGFTDQHGEQGRSLALGRARAEAAQEFLISQGVEKSRITLQSLGSAYAKGDQYQPTQLETDRRVEVWALM